MFLLRVSVSGPIFLPVGPYLGVSVQGNDFELTIPNLYFLSLGLCLWSRGVSVQGGLCPGGSLSRGVSVQGSLSTGFLSGRFSVRSWVSVWRWSLSGGGLCPRGLCLMGIPEPLYSKQRAVRFLKE